MKEYLKAKSKRESDILRDKITDCFCGYDVGIVLIALLSATLDVLVQLPTKKQAEDSAKEFSKRLQKVLADCSEENFAKFEKATTEPVHGLN
jgi:Na+-translocating ferredoxin:NAD+ oxidoreductase RnfG subunit